MVEANKYYVTVAVDRCVVPGRVMVHAANKNVAAREAEMKVAFKMRDAITVQAINVQDG